MLELIKKFLKKDEVEILGQKADPEFGDQTVLVKAESEYLELVIVGPLRINILARGATISTRLAVKYGL